MPAQPTVNPLSINLRQTDQQFMTSFAKYDAASVATLYTKEGQLLPAYNTMIVGRPAIQAFWQGFIDMGVCALQRHPIEAEQLNETVSEVGVYELFGRKGKLLDVGKYIVIWKWEQNRWQIYRDIWASNLAPGPRKEREMR